MGAHGRARDDRAAAARRPGADLRRVVHPGVRGGAGPGADQRRARLERAQGRDQGCRGRLPLRQGIRGDAAPAGAARGRGAPRGDAAEVPAAGRDPRAGRPARRHLRHRHPRRRHQRADPHRAAHLPDEVRRAQAAGAAGPGVPPDRRPRRAGRLRHHRLRRGAGARARRPQREGPGQGRRGPEEAPQGRAQEAPGGHPDLHRGDVRPPRRGRPGAADLQDAGQPRDGAQRARPVGGPAGGPAHPAARQPRGAGPPRGPRRAGRAGARLAAAGQGRRARRRLRPRGLAARRHPGCRRARHRRR